MEKSRLNTDIFDKNYIYLLIKISVFLIFIGRAYQCLFWSAPFRAFFWDESLLSPIVEGLFHISWNDYVTNLSVDKWIRRLIRLTGLLFLLAAYTSLLLNPKNKKRFKKVIFLGNLGLLFLSLLIFKDKNYDILQIFELSTQLALPTILLLHDHPSFNLRALNFCLKLIIAFTFLPHGLFALGIFYVPGHFIDMTINILGVSEDTAIQFLFVAGVLDILLSIMIFLPRVSKYFLIYAIIWGLATAFARIMAGFDMDFFWSSIHQNLYKTIYRIPHGLVPLIVYLINEKGIKSKAVPGFIGFSYAKKISR